MKFLSFTILALLACLAGAKHCLNQTIPVTITSRNAIYGNAPVPHNSIEVTAFAQAAAVQGVNGSAQAFTKFNNVQGTYNISTQFCTPDRYLSKDPMVVQVLTHGVGFDKTCVFFPKTSHHRLIQPYVATGISPTTTSTTLTSTLQQILTATTPSPTIA